MTALKCIAVDDNTLNSDPVDLVKIASPGSWRWAGLPPLAAGERVLLYDGEGLEVEATIVLDAEGWLMAEPDPATWHDTQPQEVPLPPLESIS